MSQIACPVCGKYSALSSFDPCSLDDDIYVVQFRGLGRGRGFEIVGGHISILTAGNPAVEAIKDRILELAVLFLQHRILTESELLESLSLKTVSRLKSEIEVLGVELETVRNERNRLQKQKDKVANEIESMETELAEMAEEVEDALVESAEEGEVWSFNHNIEDDVIAALHERIQILINEFETILTEESEDED